MYFTLHVCCVGAGQHGKPVKLEANTNMTLDALKSVIRQVRVRPTTVEVGVAFGGMGADSCIV